MSDQKPWYRHPWPWILMSGPFIVVIAALYSFRLAQTHITDLVTDDYYKEGKYINQQINRDVEAQKRQIVAQLAVNADHNAADIQMSGDFDPRVAMKLLIMHPTQKSQDQEVVLQNQGNDENGKPIYRAVFQDLAEVNHWYLRLEDAEGLWRVEGEWLPSQGNEITLNAMEYQFADEMQAASASNH